MMIIVNKCNDNCGKSRTDAGVHVSCSLFEGGGTSCFQLEITLNILLAKLCACFVISCVSVAILYLKYVLGIQMKCGTFLQCSQQTQFFRVPDEMLHILAVFSADTTLQSLR